MTGFGTVETAIDAMKRGAYDYILKPFKVEEVVHIVQRGLEKQRLAAENLRLERGALALQGERGDRRQPVARRGDRHGRATARSTRSHADVGLDLARRRRGRLLRAQRAREPDRSPSRRGPRAARPGRGARAPQARRPRRRARRAGASALRRAPERGTFRAWSSSRCTMRERLHRLDRDAVAHGGQALRRGPAQAAQHRRARAPRPRSRTRGSTRISRRRSSRRSRASRAPSTRWTATPRATRSAWRATR